MSGLLKPPAVIEPMTRDRLLSTPAPFMPVSGMPKLKPDEPKNFLVAFDDAAISRRDGKDYLRFVGRSERVNISIEKKFHTVTENELAEIVGHPVISDNDGKPILGEHERKVVDAALLLRFKVIENPNMSRKAKRRTIESLQTETMIRRGFGDAIEDFSVTHAEALLGHPVLRSPDGKYHDLTDSEVAYLGSVMGALESLRVAPIGRRMDIVHECRRYIREEFGEPEAKRASVLLFREAKSLAKGELSQAQSDVAQAEGEIIDIKRQQAALEEIAEWLPLDPKLQWPDGSAFHKVRAACHARDLIPLFVKNRMPIQLMDSFDVVAHSFVIEHNWASAFAGATDFEGGEVRLPFPYCAFEFQISGKRVCVIFQEDEHGTIALLLLGLKAGWTLAMTYEFASGRMTPKIMADSSVTLALSKLANLIGANVRAVLISLEAEVAETTIVRVDHKLNRAREKRGKLPLFDYHVVSLARRTRYLPREVGPLEEDREYTRKRLHFRRGHDRHYPTYKVWVKWCLVGDPDLGFVDKHYKL